MSVLSRRQWLRHTGLGIGAGAALPGLLPASQMARVLGGNLPYSTLLDQMERDVNTARRAAGPIRLMFNENPFGMSPKAKDALMGSWLQHSWYVPPIMDDIRTTFAKSVGVPTDHVLVTQGSSEVLSVLALAYNMEGGEIVAPWPTFEDLPRWGDTLKATVHRVPLTQEMEHDLYVMDAKVGSGTKLVFVCNPNNPTSNLTEDQTLREFVSNAAKRTTVIVDEAYIDFVDRPGHRSMIDLVLKGESVVVSRTASKLHGLAGLRCGFAIARPDIIKKLQQYVSGDPNVFGQLAANASIQDLEYQTFIKQKNQEGRTLLLNTLASLGRKVAPSQTNFVFFHTGKAIQPVQQYFLSKGFIVGRAFPPFNDWCRVSIGTPDEMKQFCAVVPGLFA
ncbi:MAG: aminotransferase class I/II-fold pyridoxal phosphate-dependent enzyme [Gemmatimonadaceae bacterium]|nr:aminotransferase class I/II-fold pyridoxal phosphate-dependent enzyme [Gemmatimonadaceae bacterium]